MSKPTKLILRQSQSPGDILCMTAAVRDLHAQYPGRFITECRTSCQELWANNPHVTRLADGDPEATEVYCHYNAINHSNQRPRHMVEAFHSHLNDVLGVHTACARFGGDVHLSDAERATDQVGRPYWLIVTGGKDDFTTKHYSAARLQEVVDRLAGRVQFVQVGQRGYTGQLHLQPKLRGAIDLVNQTNLRDLCRLMYHADGVVCGVTMLMHLAAAVPSKPGRPASRPAVITAGGREPPQWVQYPGHQFLHTQSMLSCCQAGGCWKNKVVTVGDGDTSVCERPVEQADGTVLPRCMDLVTADDIVRAVERFGGFA